MRHRILIVDDEQGMLEVCAETLSTLNAEIITELRSSHAARRLADESWDLLIADIRMPEIGGVDLLRIGREQDPDLPVLMMTAYPTVETAVTSMQLGASDYLTKPFLPEDLLAAATRLLDNRQLREENKLLSRQVARSFSSSSLIGDSESMRGLFHLIKRLAAVDADVLIIGETGTGKELVARSIHQQSPRANQRFVPVDCGAIPEDLIESELFGHEKGAFTGAHGRSIGLMELAHGGTFFLDEVGELSVRLQAKLLRALQERRIRRVGGKEEFDLDIRVIAATARNLDEEIEHSRFRADLYYRINVARVDIPPLRDRRPDIPLLVEHFLSRYTRDTSHGSRTVNQEAMEILTSYPWPGNVRELQNVIRRILAIHDGTEISEADIPDELIAATNGSSEGKGFFNRREERTLAFERDYLDRLLQSKSGDVVASAREAKLPRGTLYRLLKKHDLNPADYRP